MPTSSPAQTSQALHHVLGFQLVLASMATNAAFEREVATALQLSKVEFTVLQLLRDDASMSPSKLAKTLAMSAPSMTVWIDKLVERKLLTRRKSKTDGRQQQLALTPSGEKLCAQALAKLQASDAQLLAHLSLGERTILLELLRKFSREHL